MLSAAQQLLCFCSRHRASDGLALLRYRSQTCSHSLITTFKTRVVLAPAQQRCSIHHLAASNSYFWY